MHPHIGKYELQKLLGRGATGSVWLALDPFAGREVAIKLLDEMPDNPEEARRALKFFQNEASLAGKLRHPHIVSIFDAGVEKKDGKDLRYLVMELVEGTSLQPYCEPAALLPAARAAQIAYKCCRALEYANAAGVVHRDIKPANIMLRPDFDIKVSDFGAAQLARSDTTQVSGVGSPAYMSPEQIRLEDVTHHTDIYSLGVVMYKLLTGRLPFNASNQLSLTYEILNVTPPPPSQLRPELPALLDEICLKAMQKNAAQRYESWIDFGKDLSKAFGALRLAGESISDSAKFNELKALSFFEDFDDATLWEALRISQWREIPRGSVIIREGDHGESFFLLIEGEVDVSIGGTSINTIRRAGCFGELLYFSDRVTQRTTTIKALGNITVIEIKSIALRVASSTCQVNFQKAFMRVLIDRLTQANSKLAGRG